MSKTEYVIVYNNPANNAKAEHAEKIAKLLDDGYTIIASWIAEAAVHHILTKDES